MYRPSWLNLTSDMEEIISEKKDRLEGSSSSSNSVTISNSVKDLFWVGPERRRTLGMSITESRIAHVR